MIWLSMKAKRPRTFNLFSSIAALSQNGNTLVELPTRAQNSERKQIRSRSEFCGVDGRKVEPFTTRYHRIV